MEGDYAIKRVYELWEVEEKWVPTLRGYIMSTMWVMFSFSLTALQLIHVITFFASIPNNWVMAAGAGEWASVKKAESLTRRGLCGKAFPSELRWSTRNR